MEKVTKKEIRVTYYLDNDYDREIYEKLSKHSQPGRFIKDIVAKSFETDNTTNVNLETLKLLEKLTDKIDNLQISTIVTTSNSIVEDEPVQEIELSAEVTADDLDDIDF